MLYGFFNRGKKAVTSIISGEPQWKKSEEGLQLQNIETSVCKLIEYFDGLLSNLK